MMKMHGLETLDNIPPNQCQLKIIIYGSPKHPQHFISYDCTFFIDHTRLMQFLGLSSKKWKYRTLKYEYPDLLNEFIPKNHDTIRHVLHLRDWIKKFLNVIIFPKQIWKVIHDKQQRTQLRIIKHKLKVGMKQHKHEVLEDCYKMFPELNSESVCYMLNKYEFINHQICRW